jgi:hypothetical protein
VYTGTNFYTAGYTVSAMYREIPATSVVIDSETQATATWEGGVPIFTNNDQTRDERANLDFSLTSGDFQIRAINKGDEILNKVNPFTMASSSSGLACSFNGGCELTMTGTAGV